MPEPDQSDPAPSVWAILFSNGWQYTPSERSARDAERQGLTIVEYVRPAFDEK